MAAGTESGGGGPGPAGTPAGAGAAGANVPEEAGQVSLEGGSYDVIRRRLFEQARELRARADALNERRMSVFGASELALLDTKPVRTKHSGVARDMVSVGRHLMFGFHVYLGKQTEVNVGDVIALYRFSVGDEGLDLIPAPLEEADGFLQQEEFVKEFRDTFRYNDNAQLLQLRRTEHRLLAFVQIGAGPADAKVFRWSISSSGRIAYLDARGDEDAKLPRAHDFRWTPTTRENQVGGDHPHVAILDEVFVETIGGDLTIKIENNTRDGLGIYREPVDDPNQTLDDADIAYARLGVLILLKIQPFREEKRRYFVFNTRSRRVTRIDAIEQACLQLPEDHGIIFPGGYYLRTGESKRFDGDPAGLRFEQMLRSPNGEDVLYVFYRPEDGLYSLLAYNLVRKAVATPILCHGYSLFDDGNMIVFRSLSGDPTSVHPVQIWKTPFTSAEFAATAPTDDSFLAKIGNADLVRGISDGYSLCALAGAEDPTRRSYEDLLSSVQRYADAYFWLGHADAGDLASVVNELRKTASLILEEFDKVEAIRKRAAEALAHAAADQKELLLGVRAEDLSGLDAFMAALTGLRKQRGRLITLLEMREMDRSLVDALEAEVQAHFDEVSQACVRFLLGGQAFEPVVERIGELLVAIEAADKGIALAPLGADLEAVQEGLTLIGEVVGGLVVDDATARTQILEGISSVFAQVNRARASFQSRKQQIVARESRGEFAAQFALFGQSVSGALALCDSPERCDAELSRLLVSLEELEGRFGELTEFAADLAQKREEVLEAFEARRQTLMEERQRRAQNLLGAADRILSGLERRSKGFGSADELNAFYASDPMVHKLGEIAERLDALGDSVKAEDLRGRLKSARQDAVRLLRDRADLFEDGTDLIRLGQHRFAVNTQPLELTLLSRDGAMALHLTGTGYYEPVEDPALAQAQDLWEQPLVSESPELYRGEYLAGSILLAAERGRASGGSVPSSLAELQQAALAPGGLEAAVRAIAAERYDEGYERGVHDDDAARILERLLATYATAGAMRFSPRARAWATLYWARLAPEPRGPLARRARSLGRLAAELGDGRGLAALAADEQAGIREAIEQLGVSAAPGELRAAAAFLADQLTSDPPRFATSAEAAALRDRLLASLDVQGTRRALEDDLRALEPQPRARWELAYRYLEAFVERTPGQADARSVVEEAAALLVTERRVDRETVTASTTVEVTGLLGQHPRVKDRTLHFRIDEALEQVGTFIDERVPRYRAYRQARTAVVDRERGRLRLDEFTPRVLSSFVRNRLVDEVYLPLVGANLAKQLGAAGAGKRTDLMGLLLLISPPGYGKTTLMEYVASKLGLVFVKVNGPALGHEIRSLDPAEAPNATSRQEVEKIGFALEMGNNVMLYLDDIQHTNPELLQKFISLCDAQRRIEGVWRGRTRTYDLRGKRFCVVMAGNPYTESGARFQIPDMLANRADTYNLGEVLEGKEDLFALSYLENALTSNAALAPLGGRDPGDVHKLIRMAQGEQVPTTELSFGYSAAEVGEITSVLRHLTHVQQLLLQVNRQYILSAAQEEAFRVEPPFKLQGSYRNMSKLAEKIVAAMTPDELERLITDHYVAEAQTLTTGAEQNLLKLAELRGRMTEPDRQRWRDICEEFVRLRRMGGHGDDPVARVTGSLSGLDAQLSAIRDAIGEAARFVRQQAEAQEQVRATAEQVRAAVAPESPDGGQKLFARLSPMLGRLEAALHAVSRPQIAVEVKQEPPVGMQQLVEQQLALMERQLAVIHQTAGGAPAGADGRDAEEPVAAGTPSRRPARTKKGARKVAADSGAEGAGGDAAAGEPVPAAVEKQLHVLARSVESLQERLAIGVPTLARYDVELGPTTESRLFLAPQGRDLLTQGGVFVATYARAPRVGTAVHLSVAFGTGATFELRGTVVWVREAQLVPEPDKLPGFAVRLLDVDAAAREQLAAYAAMRPPHEL